MKTTILSLFMDQTHNVSCFLLYLHVGRFQYADLSNIQNTRTLRIGGVFLRVSVLSRAFSRSQGFHEQRSHGYIYPSGRRHCTSNIHLILFKLGDL